MNQNLTDADLDAIAERVLELAAKRLTTNATLPVPVHAAPLPAVTVRMPAQEKLAYSMRELSFELGISKVSIYRLVERGLLKPLPYLRTKMFAREEVVRFLRSGTNWNASTPSN